MKRLVAAPDKFKGTATAPEAADAVCRAASSAGWACTRVPMADGGEGMLAAFASLGGHIRRSRVTGPLGEPVEAEWLLDGRTAVIEMARASGLSLAGGPQGNDAMAASTAGTGELIAAAVGAGARRVIVGVGGSATTDGGLGAVRSLGSGARTRGVQLEVACDVTTLFVDASRVFAPQKGASPSQVVLLERRLSRLAQLYLDEFGVDVTSIPGSGAAGGLAGGLAAIGARLVPGFDLVADAMGLDEAITGARLVVTGEGLLDEQSFSGKVVGGVVGVAEQYRVPVLAVAGDVDESVFRTLREGLTVMSLAKLHGLSEAVSHPLTLIEHEVTNFLSSFTG